MAKKLDAQTETQVVAMIARGDTHQKIVDWLKEEKGIDMSVKTITLVKSRNSETLKFMKSELVKHQTTAATGILEKSRRLIDKKLDRAMTVEEEVKELKKLFKQGKMTLSEYYTNLDIIMKNHLTVTELNALTKESFNQSQIEANKPTSITSNPAEAKANLERLLIAIKSGDQSEMIKSIFLHD